jgi:hypothetical protein
MRVKFHDVPRAFSPLAGIQLRDMGEVLLSEDEQVTFRTESGKSNDILRKEWGFYLSNSLNAYLKGQGFKAALVRSHASAPPRLYLNLVEIEKMDAFMDYLDEFDAEVACWLDEWPNEPAGRQNVALKNQKRQR